MKLLFAIAFISLIGAVSLWLLAEDTLAQREETRQ